MSGGCRVLTLPAYSRLSSLGMSTGSPSCRSSLWMVHERAEGTGRQHLPGPHPACRLLVPRGTRRAAHPGRRSARRSEARWWLLPLPHRPPPPPPPPRSCRCRQTQSRPPPQSSPAADSPPGPCPGGPEGSTPTGGWAGEVCALTRRPGGGDAACWPMAPLCTEPTFLPFPRMALALRGDSAMDRAPFFRCWGGWEGMRSAGCRPLAHGQPRVCPGSWCRQTLSVSPSVRPGASRVLTQGRPPRAGREGGVRAPSAS